MALLGEFTTDALKVVEVQSLRLAVLVIRDGRIPVTARDGRVLLFLFTLSPLLGLLGLLFLAGALFLTFRKSRTWCCHGISMLL